MCWSEVRAASAEATVPSLLPLDPLPFDLSAPVDDDALDGAMSTEVALELLTVAAWLEREASRVRLVSAHGTLASPWPPLPSFTPGAPVSAPRRRAA